MSTSAGPIMTVRDSKSAMGSDSEQIVVPSIGWCLLLSSCAVYISFHGETTVARMEDHPLITEVVLHIDLEVSMKNNGSKDFGILL